MVSAKNLAVVGSVITAVLSALCFALLGAGPVVIPGRVTVTVYPFLALAGFTIYLLVFAFVLPKRQTR